MRLAILSSAGGCRGRLFSTLLGDGRFRKLEHGQDLLGTLVDQIGAANRPDEMAAVLQALGRVAA